MSKVRLTEKQAEALEQVKESRGKDKVMNGVLGKWYRELEPLNDLTPSQMARALYIGYEVEPEFNVRDWVHVTWSNTKPTIHKVIKTGVKSIDGDEDGIEIDWESKRPPLRIIRHATPEEIAEEKERRFFAKHDRAPWELWDKDLLISKSTGLIYEVEFATDDGVYLSIYSEIRKWVSIKQNYLVACFYSDRKDVDNE